MNNREQSLKKLIDETYSSGKDNLTCARDVITKAYTDGLIGPNDIIDCKVCLLYFGDRIKSKNIVAYDLKKYLPLYFKYYAGLIKDDTIAVAVDVFRPHKIEQFNKELPWYSIVGKFLTGKRYFKIKKHENKNEETVIDSINSNTCA